MKNHYKDIAFNIIKIYLDISYHNLYSIIEKIVTKLNIIFKIYNKVIKLDIKFYNLNFIMSVKDKKKFFEIFYICFNAIIISLNYLNILKIFNLKQLINI